MMHHTAYVVPTPHFAGMQGRDRSVYGRAEVPGCVGFLSKAHDNVETFFSALGKGVSPSQLVICDNFVSVYSVRW